MSNDRIAAHLALEESIVSGLSHAEIANYATVSGDDNPVHTDHGLAQKIGFEDVPVQGMLLMALVNNYLESWHHHTTTRKLNVRFVAPAMANQDLKITAKVMVVNQPNRIAILRVLMFQEKKLVVMGEAEVVFDYS